MYVAAALALFAVIALLTLKVSIVSITVFEYERGLEFSRGKLRGEVGPGLYLGPQLLEIAGDNVRRVGVMLQSVAVRDLTLPGDLKRMFAQVVKARQEGLAALERARGETAALRNPANAAQMVERNPHLLQLRLVQVAEQQSNSTFVVGVPQGTTLPIRDGRDVSSIAPSEGAAVKDDQGGA